MGTSARSYERDIRTETQAGNGGHVAEKRHI